ncbi:hypothetical protein L2719_05940 [Shewanella schlegeliana]|uniref:Uncharacterized protein n=1 Tax=Shewanella schlegeliana TaxID=190308 RepID=A0ABS1SZ47_9GAMM|nr:hypothetical protein [Shewanella schlegeliana]MBL4912812.1 hypothetical protein [Shewanella schlegeliana]MCL1109090.1 hypothetical protein [Shewanella schlegeliana]
MRSEQRAGTDLKLRMIGLWDEVRRGSKPQYMSNGNFDYYRVAQEYMKSKFSPELFLAYQITDRFLADIMSRRGNDNLYEVTSVIGSMMLEGEKADGILYSSVQATGEPVVAITPKAIDNYFEHIFVTDVQVSNHLGYEFYQHVTLDKASIDLESGELQWSA